MELLSNMKTILASMALSFVMFGGLANAGVEDFTDAAEIPSWADEAIEELMDQGVLAGNDDGSFAPNRQLNRAEVSKIIVLATGIDLDTTGGPHFPDVESGAWYYDYIETMYNQGWINGYPDGLFRPGVGINRAEIAKMVVNAFEVDQDLSGAPHFDDVNSSDWFYGFVETAYNNGCMRGYGDGTFGPGNAVTRAETAKIVYDCQLVVLDSFGGLSAGTLEVVLSPLTPRGTNIPFNATSVPFTTVEMTASDDADVEIASLAFTRLGLGDNDDFDNVWLEIDGFKVGNDKSVNNDDVVELRFNPPIVVPAGQTIVADLVASMEVGTIQNDDDRVNTGHHNRFALVSAADIVSSAANVVGGFPVEGEEMEIADYEVSQVEFSRLGADSTVNVGDSFVEIGKFRLLNESNSNKDVEFRAITFKNDGTAELEDVLENVALYVSGEQVSAETIMDGDYVTFRLDDGVRGGYVLEDGDSKIFSMRADIVSAEDGDVINFKVDNFEDVVGVEIGTAFGVKAVSGDSSGLDLDSSAGTSSTNSTSCSDEDAEDDCARLRAYAIDAGDLNISRDPSSLGNQEYAPGSNDVVFMTARLVADQPIIVDGVKLKLADSTNVADLAALNEYFDNFRLYLNDRLVDSENDFSGTSLADAHLDFGTTFEIAGTSVLKLVGNVEDDAPTGSAVKLVLNNDCFDSPEYISTGDQVNADEIVGSALASFVEVEESRLTITRTDGLAKGDNIVAGVDDVTFLEFVLDNNDSGDVNVTSISVQAAGTGAGETYQNYTAAIFVDGVQQGSARNLEPNGTVTFNDLSVTVPSATQKPFEIVVDTLESSANSVLANTTTLSGGDAVSVVGTIISGTSAVAEQVDTLTIVDGDGGVEQVDTLTVVDGDAGVAQVDDVTAIAGDASDTFSVQVGDMAAAVVVPFNTDAITTAADIVAAITATDATAVDNGDGTITITANVLGTAGAFTTVVTPTEGDVAAAATVTVVTPAAAGTQQVDTISALAGDASDTFDVQVGDMAAAVTVAWDTDAATTATAIAAAITATDVTVADDGLGTITITEIDNTGVGFTTVVTPADGNVVAAATVATTVAAVDGDTFDVQVGDMAAAVTVPFNTDAITTAADIVAALTATDVTAVDNGDGTITLTASTGGVAVTNVCTPTDNTAAPTADCTVVNVTAAAAGDTFDVQVGDMAAAVTVPFNTDAITTAADIVAALTATDVTAVDNGDGTITLTASTGGVAVTNVCTPTDNAAAPTADCTVVNVTAASGGGAINNASALAGSTLITLTGGAVTPVDLADGQEIVISTTGSIAVTGAEIRTVSGFTPAGSSSISVTQPFFQTHINEVVALVNSQYPIGSDEFSLVSTANIAIGDELLIDGTYTCVVTAINTTTNVVTCATPTTAVLATGTPVLEASSNDTIAFFVTAVDADNIENGQNVDVYESNVLLGTGNSGDVAGDFTGDCEGGTGNNYLCGVCFDLVSSGTLTIADGAQIENDTNIIVAGATDVEVYEIRLSAANDDVEVTDLYLTNTGTADAGRATFKLYDEAGTLLATESLTGSDLHFELGNTSRIRVPKDGTTTVTVAVDANSITQGNQTGQTVDLAFVTATEENGVEAVTSATGADLTAASVSNGAVSSETYVIYRTMLTFANMPAPTYEPGVAEAGLYRFSVSNDAAYEGILEQITLNIAESTGVTLGAGGYQLVRYSSSAYSGTGTVVGTAPAGSTAVFAGLSEDIDGTVYYELQDISGFADNGTSDNDYISVSIAEDGAPVAPAATAAGVTGNIVWSDRSANGGAGFYVNGFELVVPTGSRLEE